MFTGVIKCATTLRGLNNNKKVLELLDRTNHFVDTLSGTKDAQLLGWSPYGSVDIRINIQSNNPVHKEVADSLVRAINERMESIVRLAIFNVQDNALSMIRLIGPSIPRPKTGPLPCSTEVGTCAEGAGSAR